jgi:hypothetical protein
LLVVSRCAELVEHVKQLLTARGNAFAVPVVAVSGAAGIGKSTLAMRVAHKVAAAFPDGQLYVDLHTDQRAGRAAKLLGRFLRAFGVEGSAIPEDVTERAELYRSCLADKRVLVVLDGVSPGWQGINAPALDVPVSLELLTKILGADRVDADPDAAVALADMRGLPLALHMSGARLVHTGRSMISCAAPPTKRRMDEFI